MLAVHFNNIVYCIYGKRKEVREQVLVLQTYLNTRLVIILLDVLTWTDTSLLGKAGIQSNISPCRKEQFIYR
jgi:hypothetical protein